MIPVTGYNVETPLGRGREIFMTLPYKGVWIIEQETISIGISVLVENRSTTDMLRDSIDMVFKQRSGFGYTKDPSG